MAKGGGCGMTGFLMFLIVLVLALIGVVGYLYLKDSWVANRISQIDTKKIRTTADKSKKVYYEQVSPYSKKIGRAVKEQISKVPVTNIKKTLSEKTSEFLKDQETNKTVVSTVKELVKKSPPVVSKTTTKPISKTKIPAPSTSKTTVKTSSKTTTAPAVVKKISTIKPSTTVVPKPSAPVQKNVTVYLTKYLDSEDAFALVPVTRKSVSSSTPLEDTLKTLLAGTTEEEDSKDYTTAIPGGVQLRRIIVSNGIAKIDYNSQLESGSGQALMKARIYQIVYTATEFSTVKSVLIRIEGKSVANFAGQGLDLRSPLSRIGSAPKFKN